MASGQLPALIRRQFKAAQESRDLTFYVTRVSILQCEGIPFQIRFSPALANKPKSSKPKDSKPFDPFENPPEGLFITDIAPSHFLVLNKFPVIPDHFILATKEFKKQTDLLEEDDLGAIYACLKAYRDNGEELFGFFNSGVHSGASQPHRHIQFLPVKSMRSAMTEDMDWTVLVDLIAQKGKTVPFATFPAAVPQNASPQELHRLYISLYEQACKTAGKFDPHTSSKEESAISYNLGFTDRSMILAPRVLEGVKIKSNRGEPIGPISLNGTILGGTLLVKSEEEWDALRSDTSRLAYVLSSIGIAAKSGHGEHL